ncbi:hypothetical protein GCQ56_07735 [Marinifilum sp. N1E240]|uniref:hypothetical protein n=1 Tax=Marinifilum sp. N1E240 TaxID=2608082 RepID=UPI00128D1446|nr:hypothetical protein [Marinifilum sp. N1E240]MPQ46904.1 hypothetical protein [Marinifilum sp. N1E240]
MSKDDFYSLRPKEFFQIHHQFVLKESKQWEKVRWLATTIINFNGMQKTAIEETDLLKLPTDKEKKVKKVDLSNNTRERMIDLDEKWNY